MTKAHVLKNLSAFYHSHGLSPKRVALLFLILVTNDIYQQCTCRARVHCSVCAPLKCCLGKGFAQHCDSGWRTEPGSIYPPTGATHREGNSSRREKKREPYNGHGPADADGPCASEQPGRPTISKTPSPRGRGSSVYSFRRSVETEINRFAY